MLPGAPWNCEPLGMPSGATRGGTAEPKPEPAENVRSWGDSARAGGMQPGSRRPDPGV